MTNGPCASQVRIEGTLFTSFAQPRQPWESKNFKVKFQDNGEWVEIGSYKKVGEKMQGNGSWSFSYRVDGQKIISRNHPQAIERAVDFWLAG
jgi:hypothetical protein